LGVAGGRPPHYYLHTYNSYVTGIQLSKSFKFLVCRVQPAVILRILLTFLHFVWPAYSCRIFQMFNRALPVVVLSILLLTYNSYIFNMIADEFFKFLVCRTQPEVILRILLTYLPPLTVYIQHTAEELFKFLERTTELAVVLHISYLPVPTYTSYISSIQLSKMFKFIVCRSQQAVIFHTFFLLTCTFSCPSYS
jgi:hypothetical protein